MNLPIISINCIGKLEKFSHFFGRLRSYQPSSHDHVWSCQRDLQRMAGTSGNQLNFKWILLHSCLGQLRNHQLYSQDLNHMEFHFHFKHSMLTFNSTAPINVFNVKKKFYRSMFEWTSTSGLPPQIVYMWWMVIKNNNCIIIANIRYLPNHFPWFSRAFELKLQCPNKLKIVQISRLFDFSLLRFH